MTNYAYLMECGDPPRYLYVNDSGIFDWTPDAFKALRLARKQDGDMLAGIISDAERIVEHGFDEDDPGRPVPPHGSKP